MTPTPILPRDELYAALGNQPRLVRAFEQQAQALTETQDATTSNAEATDALQDATVLTLSPNATLNNERILRWGAGVVATDDGTYLTLTASDEVAHVQGGHRVILAADGDVTLSLPLAGALATLAEPETLSNKTLAAPLFTGIQECATDADAKVGEFYTLPNSTALHYRRS